MSQLETPPTNPYVGPRTFETGEKIYGRQPEIERITELLITKKLVLLFSPQGAGKTSLIQAGVIPRLQEQGSWVAPVIRFSQSPSPDLERSQPSVNRYLLSMLLSLEEGLPADRRQPLEKLAQANLVEYITSYLENLPTGYGSPASRQLVLIFDQFEEFLTVDPSDRAEKIAFLEQLRPVLDHPSICALFALREDFVGPLEPYLDDFPGRLSEHFYLERLGPAAALEAVIRPAEQAGVRFEPEAAQFLVDNLRQINVQRPDGQYELRPGDQVDASQLQIVLHNLWEHLAPGQTTITLDDVRQIGDVDQALAKYFAESVARLAASSGVSERQIREWFQQQLITPAGLRAQVMREAQTTRGLDNRVVSMLAGTHLIREETRLGVMWVELAHDRLIRPIQQDNARWFESNLSVLQRQATLWEQSGRPEDLLLRGDLLSEAKAWADSNPDEMTELESLFLQASQQRASVQERPTETVQNRWLVTLDPQQVDPPDLENIFRQDARSTRGNRERNRITWTVEAKADSRDYLERMTEGDSLIITFLGRLCAAGSLTTQPERQGGRFLGPLTNRPFLLHIETEQVFPVPVSLPVLRKFIPRLKFSQQVQTVNPLTIGQFESILDLATKLGQTPPSLEISDISLSPFEQGIRSEDAYLSAQEYLSAQGFNLARTDVFQGFSQLQITLNNPGDFLWVAGEPLEAQLGWHPLDNPNRILNQFDQSFKLEVDLPKGAQWTWICPEPVPPPASGQGEAFLEARVRASNYDLTTQPKESQRIAPPVDEQSRQPAEAGDQPPVYVYTRQAVELHEMPSSFAASVTDVPVNARMQVVDPDPQAALGRLGDRTQWLHLRTEAGQSGYVEADLLSSEPVQPIWGPDFAGSAWIVVANGKPFKWEEQFEKRLSDGTIEPVNWTRSIGTLAQARLRNSRPGDLVLAYSSARRWPAIIGLGGVTAGPDLMESRSQEAHKDLYQVTIQLEQRLENPVSLADLKKELPGLEKVRLGRASYSGVAPDLWPRLRGLIVARNLDLEPHLPQKLAGADQLPLTLELKPVDFPAELTPGMPFSGKLQVTNTGLVSLPSGKDAPPVSLTAEWYPASAGPEVDAVVSQVVSHALAETLAPGQTQEWLDLRFEPPAQPDNYEVRLVMTDAERGLAAIAPQINVQVQDPQQQRIQALRSELRRSDDWDEPAVTAIERKLVQALAEGDVSTRQALLEQAEAAWSTWQTERDSRRLTERTLQALSRRASQVSGEQAASFQAQVNNLQRRNTELAPLAEIASELEDLQKQFTALTEQPRKPSYGLELAPLQLPESAFVGESLPATITLTNTGLSPWTGGQPVILSERVGRRKAKPIGGFSLPTEGVNSDEHFYLSFDISLPEKPGKVSLSWTVELPEHGLKAEAGPYTIQVIKTTAPGPEPIDRLMVDWESIPEQIPAEEMAGVQIMLHNQGATAWSASRSVRLTASWEEKRKPRRSEHTQKLGREVQPNESLPLRFRVEAPGTPGDYGVTWNVSGWRWKAEVENGQTTRTLKITSPEAPSKPPEGRLELMRVAVQPEGELTAGQALTLSLTLRNPSQETAKIRIENISAAWKGQTSSQWQVEMGLDREIPPEAEFIETAALPAPTRPGDYRLSTQVEIPGWRVEQISDGELPLKVLPTGIVLVEGISVAELVRPETEFEISLSIRNSGASLWPENGSLILTASWRDLNGKPIDIRGSNLQPFGRPVLPGEATELKFTMVAPQVEGDYLIGWVVHAEGWEAQIFEGRPEVKRRVGIDHPLQASHILVFGIVERRLRLLGVRLPDIHEAGEDIPFEIQIQNLGSRSLLPADSLRLEATWLGAGTLPTPKPIELRVDRELRTDEKARLFGSVPSSASPGMYSLSWSISLDNWPEPINATGSRDVQLKKLEDVQGATQLNLPPPQRGDTHVETIFNNYFMQTIGRQPRQEEAHIAEIHVTPRLSSLKREFDRRYPPQDLKYQVVLRTLETQPLRRNIYEGPLELDESLLPFKDLGNAEAGSLLFEALFPNQLPSEEDSLTSGTANVTVRTGIRRSLTTGLLNEAERLRLQILINNEMIDPHHFRWEYLIDPEITHGPLATLERTPMARVLHLASWSAYQAEKINPVNKLRVLVALASPHDSGFPPITPAEANVVVDRLNDLSERVARIKPEQVLQQASLTGILQELEKAQNKGEPYQVLHLICHGTRFDVSGTPCLALVEPGTQKVDLVPDAIFAERLQPFITGKPLKSNPHILSGLRLVVLASCWTGQPAGQKPLGGIARTMMLKSDLPAIVAMQDEFEFEAAQHFAEAFYRTLVNCGEIDVAVNAGRRRLWDLRRGLQLAQPGDGKVSNNQWGVPVVFMRLLDGQLFQVKTVVEKDKETQAKPFQSVPGSDPQALAKAVMHSAAAQIGLQVNLEAPNILEGLTSLLSQARQEVKTPPVSDEHYRLFAESGQQAYRRWLVKTASQYRRLPARRPVLALRQAARRMIADLLQGEELEKLDPQKIQDKIRSGGKVSKAGEDGWSVANLLGAGPVLSGKSSKKTAYRSGHYLELAGHKPILYKHLYPGMLDDTKPAPASAWQAALHGFNPRQPSQTLKLELSGNLTWTDKDLKQPGAVGGGGISLDPHKKSQDLTDLKNLLSGPAPFDPLQQLIQGTPPRLDEQTASYMLYALHPERYLPAFAGLRSQVYAELQIQDQLRYADDFESYCRLGRDLLADDELGFEDLGDVCFFLQRLASGCYSKLKDFDQPASGPGNPAESSIKAPRLERLPLEPVNFIVKDIDSELVLRQIVFDQAAAALNAGKHVILIGPPGTGKTTLAEDLCRYAHDRDFNRGYILATATADWTTFDTIGGYMPEGNEQLIFRPGIVLDAIAADKWLIIDEINRADIDKSFGELFTVLSGQAVTLPYRLNNQLVRILPPGQPGGDTPNEYPIHRNWRIIGTMNIYDKSSLFAMSYAFMRRFAFVDVPVPEAAAYEALVSYFIDRNRLKAEKPKKAIQRDAKEALHKLLNTTEQENWLMQHRAIGPAIAKDMLGYIHSRLSGTDPFHHGHLAEALSLYVLPQLDGLEQYVITRVYEQLYLTFLDYCQDPECGDEAVQAVFTRIKELFPFVTANDWENSKRAAQEKHAARLKSLAAPDGGA